MFNLGTSRSRHILRGHTARVSCLCKLQQSIRHGTCLCKGHCTFLALACNQLRFGSQHDGVHNERRPQCFPLDCLYFLQVTGVDCSPTEAAQAISCSTDRTIKVLHLMPTSCAVLP